MTIHTIKLKDLNAEYVEQLKAQHDNPNQEVKLWMQQVSKAMPEDEFWYIISLLDWSKKDDTAILQPSIEYLSELSIEKIQSFQDLLSEKLYLLDCQQFAENIGQNAYKGESKPFSVDLFLYARCFVVAKGKAIFTKVQASPISMPKDAFFEPILTLAAKAYKNKTGQTFDYLPAFIYETFANSAGWNNQDFLAKILG